MKLPISVAKRLLQMIQGERVPSSLMQHATLEKMIDDGVIQKLQTKRTALLLITNVDAFEAYLQNHFSIDDLACYVERYGAHDLTRSEAIELAADSKLKVIRSFTGFLVNSYSEVACSLQGQSFVVSPRNGACTFINEYQSFVPATTAKIVGIENPENFFHVQQQQYLSKIYTRSSSAGIRKETTSLNGWHLSQTITCTSVISISKE
jgi:hypothetical protein